MSKYRDRGAYHYTLFNRLGDTYREHVLDLVAQVSKVLEPGDRIFEVGAGEGLILNRLSMAGFVCRGCDTDAQACYLAASKGNDVAHGEITEFGYECDAVLLCDVLEHVDDPIAVMNEAQRLAPVVVVAIPDREDRHASHKIEPEDVESYFNDDVWKIVHSETRHARHLMIYRRECEKVGAPSLEGASGVEV